jgi:hypothetical protein
MGAGLWDLLTSQQKLFFVPDQMHCCQVVGHQQEQGELLVELHLEGFRGSRDGKHV